MVTNSLLRNKEMKNRIVVLILGICCALTVEAQSLKILRDICPKGSKVVVDASCVVEGVVVSDWRSQNMDMNISMTSARLETRESGRTAYLQDEDGSIGVRLIFDILSENQLERYDRVRLDLKGCTVVRTSDPDAITVYGVRARAFDRVESGSGIAPKIKSIAELSDDDIYTFVTLKDVDIIFKDGSYSNVHEEYMPYMESYHSNVEYTASSRLDNWATLMRDSQGSSIYMLVNMLCPWRRTGKSLPKGTGTLSGVIVHTNMPRYGGDMGRYSIRPVDETDIALGGKSLWKTYVGWVKPEGSSHSLDFELMGTVGNLFNVGQKNDRIYNDVGSAPALLWTDSGSAVHVYSGYNSVTPENKGFVTAGAIMFVGKTVDWYEWDGDKVDGSKAFYITFNPKKMKASQAQVNFEWSAGTQDGNKCWYFPIDWKVECSVDGSTWTLLDETATGNPSFELRSVPWSDRKIIGSGHNFVKKMGHDNGLGPQQRSFNLPAEVLGQTEALIRISPATDNISRIRVKFEDSCKDGKVNPKDTERETWIRFESIMIDCM